MNQFLEFLDYLAKGTPIFLLVAGFFGYYFREKIKQVLSKSLLKDIEKIKNDLQKELATHTAQLQRDMESYKVSLISESERLKATQEVKKAIALRLAERKFNALANVLDEQMGLDTAIAAHLTHTLTSASANKAYERTHNELYERFDKYVELSNAVAIYLTFEEWGRSLKFRGSALELLTLRENHDEPAIPKGDPRIEELFVAEKSVSLTIQNLLKTMELPD